MQASLTSSWPTIWSPGGSELSIICSKYTLYSQDGRCVHVCLVQSPCLGYFWHVVTLVDQLSEALADLEEADS